MVMDPRYGAPGAGSVTLRGGDWNRLSTEIRFDRDGRFFNRFNTMTIYGGRYTRNIDDAGHGCGSCRRRHPRFDI